MKKFTLILFVVALIICGYAFFYVGLALIKVLIGLGVIALLAIGGYIGYVISKVTSKANKS